MPVRLFVGNLPYDATEAELREHFSSAGQLSFIHLPIDRESGKPRGFAFVEFREKAEADEAVRRFNNQPFKGRPLTINEARAREDRPRTGGPPPPRSPMFRPDSMSMPAMGEPPAKGDGGRKFGPDAAPRRRTKGKGGPKGGERVPKGPMREVVSSRFFGGAEDEGDDSEFDDLGENFAESAGDGDVGHDA